MEKLQKWYETWLLDYHNGELLFFIGFIIYLGRNTWITTTFPFPNIINKLCLLLPLLLIVLKIFFFDSYRVKPLLILCLSMIVSLMIYCSSGYLNVLFWLLLVLGSKDISFKKILEIYLLITGSIVLLAFCSSLLGVIENYQYVTTSRGIRNSFGITYTTDFASHIFFLILAFFYLMGENLKFYHYMGTLIIAALIYHFCNARLDSCSIVLIVIVFSLGNWIEYSKYSGKNFRKLWKNNWAKKGIYIMLLLAVVSVVVTNLYRPENKLLSELNTLFSSRLYQGQKGIKEYGYKLFGQYVELVGGGGSESHAKFPSNYFFVDCPYIYVVLRYGVLFTVFVVTSYMAACHKNRHDLYFLYTIALIAVNCTIAHHLLEFEYNPFALSLLSISVRNNKSDSDILTNLIQT